MPPRGPLRAKWVRHRSGSADVGTRGMRDESGGAGVHRNTHVKGIR